MKRKISVLFIFIFLLCSTALLFDTTALAAVPKKPKLNIKKLEMTVGSEFTLRVYNLKKKYKVSYSSNKPINATVEAAANGKSAQVTANDIGSATIQVIVRKGKKTIRKLKCKVKISPVGISIKFLKRKLDMAPGDMIHVEPIIKPNTSTECPIYESSNPQAAIISSRGTITALAPGETTITATLLSSGQKTTCIVSVSGSEVRPTIRPKMQYDVSSGLTSTD